MKITLSEQVKQRVEAEFSIVWVQTQAEIHYPIVNVGDFEIRTLVEISQANPDEVDYKEYEEDYGVILQPDLWYYLDGECFQNSFEPEESAEGFTVWLAEQINSKLSELNEA